VGFGLGLIHYIPLIAYLGFPIMCVISLAGRPLWALCYLIPFLPYRSMRDHFNEYPLGEHALTILILAVIAGAIIHGKRLPPSKLYLIWLILSIYLYLSMWLGAANGIAPAPLWTSDSNFTVWKDYMLVPLVFVATVLVIEDRKSIKMIIILTAITLLIIDRSCILESVNRSWASFDETKRDRGPLVWGANLSAAYLVQFAMFVWGVSHFVKRKTYKIIALGAIAASFFALLYTFSRGGYLAALVGIFILGVLKDRKLLIFLGILLLTWQMLVPTAVRERIEMTKNSTGELDASAQQRVELWKESWQSIKESPFIGKGYATFQYGLHAANLKDSHNLYVKVWVETGIVGLAMVLILLQQMFSLGYHLFRRGDDALYRGLGLGLLLATCCSVVTNFFGDRWNFIEISGPMWVLVATAVSALNLKALEQETDVTPIPTSAPIVSVIGTKKDNLAARLKPLLDVPGDPRRG
jgi:putative inorganic carbon (hco3(-)) transporter